MTKEIHCPYCVKKNKKGEPISSTIFLYDKKQNKHFCVECGKEIKVKGKIHEKYKLIWHCKNLKNKYHPLTQSAIIKKEE